MTNEGSGVYSPAHWDPCPCEYCLERELAKQKEQQEQKQEETTND